MYTYNSLLGKATVKDQQSKDQRQLVTYILSLIEPPKLANLLQLEDDPDLSVSLDYQTASSLPLFSSLSSRLLSIYQKVLQSLHELNRTPQSIHASFTREVQKSPLASVIQFIESKDHLREAFEKDFVSHTLKMPNLKSPWIDICISVVRYLATCQIKYDGILKLYLVTETQLAFLNVCFKPLQMLEPVPSIESLAHFREIPELVTVRDIEFFAAKMTISILWDRFSSILDTLNDETTSEILGNWFSVFRALESRLKNRRYLGLSLELQASYDIMKTVFLYMINFPSEENVKCLSREGVKKHIDYINFRVKEVKYNALHDQLLLAQFIRGSFDTVRYYFHI